MKQLHKKLTLISFLTLVAFSQLKADPFAGPKTDPFSDPQVDQYIIECKFITAPSKWIRENQLKDTPREVTATLFKNAMDSDSIDLLSAPRITSKANHEARIIIQEAPLTYMEKVGEGYQPRTMPEGTGPGVQFTAKMKGMENKPGHCLLDWSTKITSLSGREPVPFALEVGKPILQIQEHDYRIECFNDRWYYLNKMASFDAEVDESILIFCKVKKVLDTDTVKPRKSPIKIVSDEVINDKGVLKATGNVQIQEKDYVIHADKLEFIQDSQPSKGPAIQADAMSLETPDTRVRYSGNVRMRINGGVIHSEELYIQQLVEAPKVESSFEKKLKQIIIPNLSFKEVKITDAIDFLRELSAQHSPDGKRVEFVLTPQVNTNVSVNLELRNIPLYHIIRILTQSCGQDFVLDEEAGVILII